jgi:hypothetical protein
MNYTDNINFKGKYRKYDPHGKELKYIIGDTVEFNGIYYTATKSITGIAPNVKNSGWELLSNNSNFYIEDAPPTGISYKGDRWFNSSTGVLYTRIKDDNGMHWVEL